MGEFNLSEAYFNDLSAKLALVTEELTLLKVLASDQQKLLYAALSKAQGEFPEIPKTRVNPFFNSKYADIADIRKAVTPALAKYGLAVSQIIKGQTLVTTVFHSGGGSISSNCPLRLSGKPQEIGSELTYMRRYCLSAILGVAADEDDDGNAAQSQNLPNNARNANTKKAPANAPKGNQSGSSKSGKDRQSNTKSAPAKTNPQDINPEKYIIPFKGKFQGRITGEMTVPELEEFMNGVMSHFSKQNQDLPDSYNFAVDCARKTWERKQGGGE